MKKIATLVLILALFFSVASYAQQNVGIGTTTPDPNAKLDITSTNQGLLIPRMSTATRNAIVSPATSLLIYNTTTDCLEMYSAGAGWVSIGCGCQLPGSFTASAASGVLQTAFAANWAASAGATNYFLDVSTVSNFATFVTGYSNLSVGNVTTFTVNTNLTCASTYFYRIRANNTCGTSTNSGTITLTTLPCGAGCGTQVWATANLNAGSMVNGGVTQTGNQEWCQNNTPANCTTYGGLYQFADALGGSFSNTATSTTINCDPCTTSSTPAAVQGLCPASYHIPSDLEWSRYSWCIENTIIPAGTTSLANFQVAVGFQGSTTAGVGPSDKMRATNTWTTTPGTNTSGFTALPAGNWNATSAAFTDLGTFAFFLSASESSATQVFFRELSQNNPATNPQIFRGTASSAFTKSFGYSVRCLHN